MKTLKPLFLVVILFQLTCFGQNNTIIKPGLANISTLIVDYDSYKFEGANMSYYCCPSCQNDRLPFLFEYKSPGDFGGITIRLKPTFHIIFDASIIWMGQGKINYPTDFNLYPPFNYITNPIPKPIDLAYFNMDGNLTGDSAFIHKADSAWDVIKSLEITNIFSEHSYKAGIYLYPPAVGVMDPTIAKWIVFLYSSDIADENRNPRDFSPVISPNPTKSMVELHFNTIQPNTLMYRVCDLTGIILEEGVINQKKNQVDFSSFPKGMYFMMILNNKGSYLRIEKIIKE